MKRWLAVALLAVACSSIPEPQEPEANAGRLNAFDATIVLLDQSDSYAMCSGEFVTPELIATAAHCVDNVEEAKPGDGFSYLTLESMGSGDLTPNVALLFAVDRKLDIAVLRALEPHRAFVSIVDVPGPGASVHALGHPKGALYKESHGMLLMQHGEVISALVSLNQGCSGGGLYDADYHLIGIAVRMYAGGNVGEFVSASELLRLL